MRQQQILQQMIKGSMGLMLLLGGACGDKEESEEGTVGGPYLVISSPTAEGWYDEGESVTFAATAQYDDGSSAPLDAVEWSMDGWSASGAEVTVTDLPPGNLTITATGQAADQTVTADIALTVWASTGGGDTGS